MSWQDEKKRGGGYSRGRGYRQNRGNNYHGFSENKGEDGGYRQHSGGHRGRGGYRGRPYKRSQSNYSYDGKRKKYEIGIRLTESEIGVTEYLGDHKRINGIVKERYNDFSVHEIDLDGDICKLTNHDMPPEPEDLEDTNVLKESIPEDIRIKLESFSDPEQNIDKIEVDVTELDKTLRRNIHAIVKRIKSVVSETVDRDERKIIVVTKKNTQSNNRNQNDRRTDWSTRGGDYCHFLLHKVNMDTMEALSQLALQLRLKQDLFNYAGTKDRRGRTTQWVSLKRVYPQNIHRAARRIPGAHVGNFKICKQPLRLGCLSGNHFKIALRSVSGTDEDIERAVNSLRDNGFINYYGLQRFGSTAAIPTHEIGKALLQSKWNEAIDLILKPRESEQQPDMREARDIYNKTKNPTAALKPIAQSGKIEAKLLKGIEINGASNPQGALDHLPRNARLMYIHSYQSLVWNNIVSRRIREFGSKPIVGDFVYVKSDNKEVVETETMDYGLENNDEKVEKAKKVEEQTKESMDLSETVEKNEEDVKDVAEKSEGDEEPKEMKEIVSETNGTQIDGSIDEVKDTSSLPTVRALTEEDLENYTLADIVMPKPGWQVAYPAYAKPWFDEFLAKDGLTTDLRQKNRKYSLSGSYRTIMEKPKDLTWRIARYNGYHDDLILSDIDEMRGYQPPKDIPDGKHKALILEFSLKTSAYATMAIREILEHDTSAHTQATQSAANQAQNKKEEDAKKMETEVEPEADAKEAKEESTEEENIAEAKKNDKPPIVEDSEMSEIAEGDKIESQDTEDDKIDVEISKKTEDVKIESKNAEKAEENEMEVVEIERVESTVVKDKKNEKNDLEMPEVAEIERNESAEIKDEKNEKNDSEMPEITEVKRNESAEIKDEKNEKNDSVMPEATDVEKTRSAEVKNEKDSKIDAEMPEITTIQDNIVSRDVKNELKEKTDVENSQKTEIPKTEEKTKNESDENKMEVVEEKANIPTVDETQEMETESIEINNVTGKV